MLACITQPGAPVSAPVSRKKSESLTLRRRNAKYVVRQAAALAGMRRPDEARGAYERALRLSPGYEAAERGLRDLSRATTEE